MLVGIRSLSLSKAETEGSAALASTGSTALASTGSAAAIIVLDTHLISYLYLGITLWFRLFVDRMLPGVNLLNCILIPNICQLFDFDEIH